MFILLLLGLGCGGYYLFRGDRQAVEYVPSERFAPAYHVLEQAAEPHTAADSTGSGYDIEKTVRIMNSFEVAQTSAGSFDEFLEYMARQDYRGVASEVLNAKKNFFPLLEEMAELQRKIEDASTVWGYMNAISGRMETRMASEGVINVMVAAVASNGHAVLEDAFDTYVEQKEMKRKARKRLRRIHRQYVNYLESYMPVYCRYMDEWNRLCLIKDKVYIDVYSGRMIDAFNQVEKLLEMHPVNREGLLLKALALTELGARRNAPELSARDTSENRRYLMEAEIPVHVAALANPLYCAAERLLDQYMSLYPDESAPALLVKGMLYEKMGDLARAISYYEQAAVEYPRQAEALTDMLNSYVCRTYLTRSVEGNYLLNYYRSTMEGFGIFSPNFRKAALYMEQGDAAKSEEEIYKHFFRRGNQAAIHCLLSDMQYCEEFLYGSFKPLMIEQACIDLGYRAETKFLGMSKNDDQVEIELHNRSDSRLENIRLFLCIHYTGMYKDDYEVVRLDDRKNVIEPYSRVQFSSQSIEPHSIDDIAHMRAIMLTDDKICWVDTPQLKMDRATSRMKSRAEFVCKSEIERERFDHFLPYSASRLIQLIKNECRIEERSEGEWWSKDQKVKVEMPRVLTLLDPYCTIGHLDDDEVVHPENEMLSGKYLQLIYDLDKPLTDKMELFVYSRILDLCVDFIRENGQWRVDQVREV